MWEYTIALLTELLCLSNWPHPSRWWPSEEVLAYYIYFFELMYHFGMTNLSQSYSLKCSHLHWQCCHHRIALNHFWAHLRTLRHNWSKHYYHWSVSARRTQAHTCHTPIRKCKTGNNRCILHSLYYQRDRSQEDMCPWCNNPSLARRWCLHTWCTSWLQAHYTCRKKDHTCCICQHYHSIRYCTHNHYHCKLMPHHRLGILL